eukprot:1159543-Pelagomonas_calceolata.AAC.4
MGCRLRTAYCTYYHNMYLGSAARQEVIVGKELEGKGMISLGKPFGMACCTTHCPNGADKG